MAGKHSLISLDEICGEFPMILIDTCALTSFLECKSANSVKLKKRIIYKREGENSFLLFRKSLNKSGFFITSSVFDELYSQEITSIKDVLGKYDSLKISKKEKEYFREICSLEKEKRRLLKQIKKRKGIVNLVDYEKREYYGLFNKYLKLQKRYSLSNTDYDLLITGAVFSAERGRTALLSNDFSIFHSYKCLLSGERISASKYAFFSRPKREFFLRA